MYIYIYIYIYLLFYDLYDLLQDCMYFFNLDPEIILQHSLDKNIVDTIW